jgi:DivIVA domain-containing protein
MPLTPAQVRGVAFNKPPIGKRGYHEDEVDALLNVVEAELARLLEENTHLRNQLTQGDQQPPPEVSNTAATPRQPALPAMNQPHSGGEADYHHHAARVLNLAQQTADRMISQAQAEADAYSATPHPRPAAAAPSPNDGRGSDPPDHTPGANHPRRRSCPGRHRRAAITGKGKQDRISTTRAAASTRRTHHRA